MRTTSTATMDQEMNSSELSSYPTARPKKRRTSSFSIPSTFPAAGPAPSKPSKSAQQVAPSMISRRISPFNWLPSKSKRIRIVVGTSGGGGTEAATGIGADQEGAAGRNEATTQRASSERRNTHRLRKIFEWYRVEHVADKRRASETQEGDVRDMRSSSCADMEETRGAKKAPKLGVVVSPTAATFASEMTPVIPERVKRKRKRRLTTLEKIPIQPLGDDGEAERYTVMKTRGQIQSHKKMKIAVYYESP